MFHYLTVALLAVAAPLVLSEPSGLLTIGGPIIGGHGLGLGLGGLGLNGLGLNGLALNGLGGYGLGGLGYGYGGAVVAAPSSLSIQKTIVAHPAPAVAVAAPIAVAAPALAIPSPAASTVVAGPSGVIQAKQSLAGTFATVTGPASVNHGIGHGW